MGGGAGTKEAEGRRVTEEARWAKASSKFGGGEEKLGGRCGEGAGGVANKSWVVSGGGLGSMSARGRAGDLESEA